MGWGRGGWERCRRGGWGVDRAHWRKKATWSGFPPASDGYVEDFLAHGMHDCSA